MSEDEDEALRILDEMLPNERRALVDHLDRLSLLADDTQRCPRCGRVVDPLSSVARVGVGFGRSAKNWHRDCLDAQRAEEV
jgi:hypothetical protein